MNDLNWAIIAPEAEVVKWSKAFKETAPHINLQNGLSLSDPEKVDVLLLWNHPKGALQPFTNVKLYYSLGAGVDHLLKDEGLNSEVPICRIVDPLLSFSMSNYIVFAVLYHQRKWDKYSGHKHQKIWDHDSASEEEIKIGVLGLGTLGQDAAKKLAHLGFEVSGYSPSPKQIEGITTYSGNQLDAFLKSCNVLVCTVPYTPQTHQLLSMSLFEKLHHPSFLINVARGKVQNEQDIIKALELGYLSGAFLDVFETEPLPKESPLWTHPLVQITPHIASITNPNAGVKQIVENSVRLQKSENLLHLVNLNKGY